MEPVTNWENCWFRLQCFLKDFYLQIGNQESLLRGSCQSVASLLSPLLCRVSQGTDPAICISQAPCPWILLVWGSWREDEGQKYARSRAFLPLSASSGLGQYISSSFMIPLWFQLRRELELGVHHLGSVDITSSSVPPALGKGWLLTITQLWFASLSSILLPTLPTPL